jgi:hypothetical protein
VATDVGKHVYISTGGVTVNASVFNAGDVFMVVNPPFWEDAKLLHSITFHGEFAGGITQGYRVTDAAVDEPGRDLVDADLVTTELLGQRQRESGHARLGGSIVNRHLQQTMPGDRA